jgi:hypothetical protein
VGFTQDGGKTTSIAQDFPPLLEQQLADIEKAYAHTNVVIETGVDSPYLGRKCLTRLMETAAFSKDASEASPRLLLLLSPAALGALQDSLGTARPSDVAVLDESLQPSEELEFIQGRLIGIATTPRRIIDHIRRNNLSVRNVRTLVAMDMGLGIESGRQPYELRNFVHDTQFIATKLHRRCFCEFFTSDFSRLEPWDGQIFTRSQTLAKSAWDRLPWPIEFRWSADPSPQDVTDILCSAGAVACDHLVICGSADYRTEVSIRLRRQVPLLDATTIDLDAVLSGSYNPRPGQRLDIVTYGLSLEECSQMLRQSLSWPAVLTGAVCILPDFVRGEILETKETLLMNNEIKSTPTDLDVLTGKIQLLAGKTRADANPEELDQLKKLIKKNVPFALRGYFMAYLLRELLAATDSARPRAKTPRTAPVERERQPRAPRQSKPQGPVLQPQKSADDTAETNVEPKPERIIPEGAKTLYLNIGKMKRLYAKELSQLLQTELGVTREDIYSIRIHDKYSFITMSEENCEKAIEKINGMDIKGRTASVSYSNKE